MSFTVTINNLSPALERRDQEIAVVARGVHAAADAARKDGGKMTSGVILIDNAVQIGTWSWTPQAAS